MSCPSGDSVVGIGGALRHCQLLNNPLDAKRLVLAALQLDVMLTRSRLSVSRNGWLDSELSGMFQDFGDQHLRGLT